MGRAVFAVEFPLVVLTQYMGRAVFAVEFELTMFTFWRNIFLFEDHVDDNMVLGLVFV